MRTRGIITFAGPVKRETLITPSGPVARATYQWDIKKGVSEVIPLDAIKIPWFDTLTRTQREAEIPARQIGGGLADREEDLKPAAPASWPALAAAALAAFGLGLALIGFRTGSARLRLDRGQARRLRLAAAAGDAAAFRAALGRAAQAQPDLAALWRSEPDLARDLAALDRTVFGQTAESEAPLDLPDLARRLARPRRLGPSAALAPEPRLAPSTARSRKRDRARLNGHARFPFGPGSIAHEPADPPKEAGRERRKPVSRSYCFRLIASVRRRPPSFPGAGNVQPTDGLGIMSQRRIAAGSRLALTGPGMTGGRSEGINRKPYGT
ncbi:hypothetical protein GCM10025880_36470 [Methylorubrum aminovorans]|nr:hypothetical protein GCM10025880_36470 [Methylorubrum aminovorans]